MIAVQHIHTDARDHIRATHTVIDQELPLVVSVPHGGMYVLATYTDHFTFGDGIRVDNDMYTADLYPHTLGSSIIAHLAPHQVNLNRAWDGENERDPITTASFIPDDPIYTTPWTDTERAHLKNLYDTYHTDLANLMYRMRDRYGYALLIDCHALNSRALANTPDAGSTERADFIIGSLDDTSADTRIVDLFHESLAREATPRGLQVVRNDPYKGGNITKTWAQPGKHLHVLQLEIKKSTYMHEGIDGEATPFAKKDSFAAIAHLLTTAFQHTRDGTHQLLATTPARH